MSGTHAGSVASPFRQPKAVFAVALACVVSFMGIGLVDPILPAISHQLHASPSEVTLLFTSYLVVTAVAMLITNWVSSRLGAKKTLIAGLILIVLFSALAGAAPSIGGIIGFRAGWGVGNALFIATSLAVIVASATGGFAGAIVLYETALGVGIAIGPLLGGTLGEISWRGPFFGVSALMAIALIATVVLVEPTPKPAHKTSLSAPLRALRHRGLLIMSLTALCYNWGFFTVLGYAPFPMNLSPIKLGLVFTGWGIFVALFAVFGAPRLQASFGIAKTMYANLAAFAVVVLVIAIWTTDRAVLIPAVIISGAFIGVNNTVTTQAVMTVSPVEKPVASAAYSFVRFIGGGLAPYAAGRLVLAVNIHFPFYIAVGAILAGIVILSTAHGLLTQAEQVQAEQVTGSVSAASAGPVGALIPVEATRNPLRPAPASSWPQWTALRSPPWSPKPRPPWRRTTAVWCTWCTPRKKPPRTTWPSTARAWTRPGPSSGITWTGWPRTTSRPRARSCCTRPTTAPPGGWSPSTPTPSGPAPSWSARPATAGWPR